MKLIIDLPDHADVNTILRATENALPLSTYLEKIKEEMMEKHNKEVGIIYKSILTMNIGVIDKHISELKED